MSFSCWNWGVRSYSCTPSHSWGGWGGWCAPKPSGCNPHPHSCALPVADDDTISFAKSATPTDITASLLAGDTGQDRTTSTGLRITAASVVSVGANGDNIDASDIQLVVGTDGKVTVATIGDFAGLTNGESLSFEIDYTVTDPSGRTDVGRASITVTTPVVLPVADDDTISFEKSGTPTDITASLLAGDTGTDGTTSAGLTISSATVVSVGVNGDSIDAADIQLVVAPDGTVTIATIGDFANLSNGESLSFVIDYTVTDTAGRTDVGSATVTVTTPVVLPVADDDIFSFVKTSGATNITATLLDGDTGPDGTTSAGLTVTSAAIVGVEDNTEGIDISDFTVLVGPDGVSIVTAGDFVNLNNGETIVFELEYAVTDSAGNSDTALAVITVLTDEG